MPGAHATAISALRDTTDGGPGGTFQARYERDVIFDQVAQRLSQLDLGDQSLVFGRIDKVAPAADGASADDPDPSDEPAPLDRYYIGRLAVADDDQEPVVVDWRAPVAEAFYRATGREPMDLVRRRHFATRGRELLAIEDELFGDGTPIGARATARLHGRGRR